MQERHIGNTQRARHCSEGLTDAPEADDADTARGEGGADEPVLFMPRAGTHRAVDGENNWVVEMEPFVGRVAVVQERIGVDDQGCPLVAVDVDQGDFYWRVRDLRLAE